MSKAINTERVTASGAVLLDPDLVASSIRYRFALYKRNGRSHFDGEVVLTDCDKQIRWSAWNGDMLELDKRIAKAVAVLEQARQELSGVCAEYLRRQQKPKRKVKK